MEARESFVDKLNEAKFGSVKSGKAILTEVERKTARSGNEFLVLHLHESGRNFDSRVFSNHKDYRRIRDMQTPCTVAVQIKVNEHMNNRSFIVERCQVDSPEIDESLIDTDSGLGDKLDEAIQFVKTKIEQHSNEQEKPRWISLINSIDAKYGSLWRIAPAAVSIHHNYRNGLAEHTCEVVKIADSIFGNLSPAVPRVRVHTLVGALLHDIGKIEEYEYDNMCLRIKVSEKGKLVPHIGIGIAMFEAAAEEAKLSAVDRDEIRHIILSHHGRLEWGSPVEPQTISAHAVHLADVASARIRPILNADKEKFELEELCLA